MVSRSCGSRALLDKDLWSTYEVDWTGRWQGRAAAVVRPRDAGDVVTIVRAARECRVALVPRGGGTGLVGGATPTSVGDQVVLDLSSLKGVQIDPVAATAVVGSGVTLTELNEAAGAHDLRFAVDISSRDSATVGGMVSTNAGGLRMLRFGDTAAQLLGVEMVTGAGELVSHMRGLTKDNVGVRWHQLLAGSEGTLGVLCRVLVKLVPTIKSSAHGWFPVRDAAHAVEVAALARRFEEVSAVEYVHREGTRLVERLLGHAPPTEGSAVIVEASSTSHEAGPIGALVEMATRLGMLEQAQVGEGPVGWKLWQWRDRHTESIATYGIPAKCDAAVPLSNWAQFHDEVPEVLAAVRGDLWAVRFGHIADGNLHVNVLTGDGTPPPAEADDAIWRLSVRLGGTISAEHGIGVAKAPWLHLVRSTEERKLLEQLRQTFDPAGVCAPHLLRAVDDRRR